MFRNVIVPLDGSPLAEQAIGVALGFCRRAAATLHLLHVRTLYRHAGDETEADPERAYLDDVCARVRGSADGASVACTVMPEEPPQLLVPSPTPGKVASIIDGYAREHGCDLIVMATHGRGGFSRLWFGSVADAVLRTGTAPVLLVRPEDGDEPGPWSAERPLSHVLVPLDGSRDALAAIEPARALGGAFRARYTLLRSLAPPIQVMDGLTPMAVVLPATDPAASHAEAEADLDAAARPLRAASAEVATAVVIDSSAARAILQAARDRDADVIVLAARVRGGFDRIVLGSVMDKVVRGADVPVLVVRPETAAEQPPAAAEPATA